MPLKIVYRNAEALTPYAGNARTHSAEQVAQIARSIEEFGWTNPILVDGDGGVIAGHGRLMAAKEMGIEKVPTITVAGLTETQKRALVIADNKLALNAGWDFDILGGEIEALTLGEFDLSLLGFTADELAALTDEEGEPSPAATSQYSGKIEAPTYTPKGEKPEITELLNRGKMDALLAQIEAADGVSHAEKQFLAMAAARHMVFDYHQIAEFYCHASPAVQALMEASALVIIDFDKAIEGGYVQLSKRLSEIYGATDDEDEHVGADA